MFGLNMALFDNPTELWQVRANAAGQVPGANNLDTGWAAQNLSPSQMEQTQGVVNPGTQSGDGSTVGAPALDMVRGADGNYTNRNADANQAFMRQSLYGQNGLPQPDPNQVSQAQTTPTDFWSSYNQQTTQNAMAPYTTQTPDASNLQSGGPQINLVQDAQGNWSNANADANQSYMRDMLGDAPQATNGALSASDQAYFNSQDTSSLQNNVAPDVASQLDKANPGWRSLPYTEMRDAVITAQKGSGAGAYDSFNVYNDALNNLNKMTGTDRLGGVTTAMRGAVPALADYLKDPVNNSLTQDQLANLLQTLTMPNMASSANGGQANSNAADIAKAFGFDLYGAMNKLGYNNGVYSGNNIAAQTQTMLNARNGALQQMAQYMADPVNRANFNGAGINTLIGDMGGALNSYGSMYSNGAKAVAANQQAVSALQQQYNQQQAAVQQAQNSAFNQGLNRMGQQTQNSPLTPASFG